MVKLVCNRCQAIFSVPDDALPGRAPGTLKCALCREPMEVQDNLARPGEAATPLQLMTAGGRKMLVAISGQLLAERVTRAMSGHGWQVVAATPDSAQARFDNTPFDVVVLDAGDRTQNRSRDPVLSHLQRLPMPERRTFILCLVSGETPTLNSLAAFRAGVDLIVNAQDIEQFSSILDYMMKDHEAAYAKFDEEMRRRGTSLV